MRSVTVLPAGFKLLSRVVETQEELGVQAITLQTTIEAPDGTDSRLACAIADKRGLQIAESPWKIAACGRLAHPIDFSATRPQDSLLTAPMGSALSHA